MEFDLSYVIIIKWRGKFGSCPKWYQLYDGWWAILDLNQ